MEVVKRLGGILVVALVLSTVSYVSAEPSVSGDSSSSQWLSAQEMIRSGRLAEPENVIDVTLQVHADNDTSRDTVAITNVSQRQGYLPEVHVPPGGKNNALTISLTDSANKPLSSTETLVDHRPDGPPPLTGQAPDESVFLPTVTTVVTLRAEAQAKHGVVKNAAGTIVATTDLAMLPRIPTSQNFSTRVNGSSTNQVSWLPKAQAIDGRYLDITFIGDDYTVDQMPLFHDDVDRFIANLLSVEPYKSRAADIVFRMVDNTTDLGCVYNGRVITCSDPYTPVQASGTPYDEIIAIVNNSTYGGSGGGASVSVAYNGTQGADVFVHELGHTLGWLYDEYNIYTSDGYIDGWTHANCYSGTPPTAQWGGMVAIGDYTPGCYFPNWYRSSQGSIMYSLSYRYFNRISQNMLNSQIDLYTGAYTNLVPPTAAITSPADGATVSYDVPITYTATDDAGVAFTELYVDGVLYRTNYVAPYNLTWSTNHLYPNGGHTLMVKAYDTAGNVTDSSIVNVNLNNDVTAPSITITSPQNNATVKGNVNVLVNASDNVGITRVELYADSSYVATSTTAPYTTTWRAVNGTHTLQTKAYDAAGNVGVSLPITVKK